MPVVQAKRAQSFPESVGANLHITWGGGTSWADKGRIVQAAKNSGIFHFRDSVPYDWSQDTYEQLYREVGGRFLIIPDRGMYNPVQTYRPQFDNMARLLDACPGSIVAMEGFNEINNAAWTINVGSGNTAANLSLGRALQEKLWSERLAHPHPGIKALKIANLTVASISPDQAFASLGNMAGWADYGTWHTYFGQGDQPRAMLQNGWNGATKLVPGKPAMLTETGYYTAVQDMGWGGGGVDYPTQAKLLANLLLAAYEMGFARSYIYSLMDDPADLNASTNIESSFGICRGDGSPKPAATTIKRLIDLLRDSAPTALSFSPGTLDLTITGMPSTGKSLVFQKADGTFVVVLWSEVDIWDQPNKRSIGINPSSVTLTLARPAKNVLVSAPFTGAGSVTANVSVIPVSLGDHPVVISISGLGDAGTVEPPPPPASGDRTIGTGKRKLALRVTQDAYQGSCQYTVAVDGVAVGGTLTAVALRGGAAADTITVQGDWAPGDHRVTVTFLNDLYGGLPNTDRNLYVEGASLDGVAVPDSALTLLSAGGQSFSFRVAAVEPPPDPEPGVDYGPVVTGAKALAAKVKAEAATTSAAADALLAMIAKLPG